MIGMKAVFEAILVDILLPGGKILTQRIHIRQNVVVILLKTVVGGPVTGEFFIVKIAVADRRADHHAVIGQNPFMPDNIGGDGLHHKDRIGAHAVAVMKGLRHPEHEDIVGLFRPGHIGPFVRDLPGKRLHLRAVAAEHRDLAGFEYPARRRR